MKILWTMLRPPHVPGGAEKHFFEFAKRLVRDGIDVSMLTTDIVDINTLLTNRGKKVRGGRSYIQGVEVIVFSSLEFPMDRKIAKALSKFSLFFNGIFGIPHIPIPAFLINMLFREGSFDAVISGPHPYYSIIFPSFLFAKRNRIPFIDFPLLHTGLPFEDLNENLYLSPVALFLLNHADAVFVNTPEEIKICKKAGVSDDKFFLAPPGINPEELGGGNGKRFREKYGIKGSMILQISVHAVRKGTPTVLKALKKLRKKGINVTGVFIGEVLEEVRHLIHEKDCLFLGRVDEDTKKDALDACDVFVMPSATDSFGIVYLEAWMYEKPVIGAYAGGVPYVIDDGVNGFLIPFGDYHMLSEYIEILLKNKNLARKMGKEGKKKVLTHFTWEISYRKFRTALDTVLRKFSHPQKEE